jgi:hypothetical protein
MLVFTVKSRCYTVEFTKGPAASRLVYTLYTIVVATLRRMELILPKDSITYVKNFNQPRNGASTLYTLYYTTIHYYTL